MTLKDGSTDRIEARTKIWAAGVQASPLGRILGEQSDATVDRAGRVSVQPDCTLPGHPEVFVIGDMMSLDRLPGLAEVAMQSGRHASRDDRPPARGRHRPAPVSLPRPRDDGDDRSVSRGRLLRPRAGHGMLAWLIWLFVHLAFLTGFKNRVAAVASWAVAFLGRGRTQRTITEQQVLARTRAIEGRPRAHEAPDMGVLAEPAE